MHPNLPARLMAVLTILLACLAGSACAQDYPSRVIRIIVPISTGSTTDVVARIVAEGMRASLGQSVIVENRPGAGGTVGSTVVAKAAPMTTDAFDAQVVREVANIRERVRVAKIPVSN